MTFTAVPSQNEFLSHLIHSKQIDWSKINAFHADKYIGIHPEAPQSFGNFLRQRTLGKVPFRTINHLNEQAENLEEECKCYSELLLRHPIGIVCLGIGENGHIALNDPDVANFNDSHLVRIVRSGPIYHQQQVNEKCFGALDLVPAKALALTTSALLKTDWMFYIVPFKNKVNAVCNTLYGEISEKCPANILRKKESSYLCLDPENVERIDL